MLNLDVSEFEYNYKQDFKLIFYKEFKIFKIDLTQLEIRDIINLSEDDKNLNKIFEIIFKEQSQAVVDFTNAEYLTKIAITTAIIKDIFKNCIDFTSQKNEKLKKN